jgi:hypothetical protein
MTYSELIQIVFATYDTLAWNFKQYNNDGLFVTEFCWCRVILERRTVSGIAAQSEPSLHYAWWAILKMIHRF